MEKKKEPIKIALVGNPNSGKSSLFNILTGLRQTVSNFPGVTVDKKIGTTTLDQNTKASVIDLPGLYSLHPNSGDEKLVVNVLTNNEGKEYPDLIIYVADSTNLERHMLLATQIIDLNIPMVFVLNMIDILDDKAQELNPRHLADYLQVPIVPISGRNGTNIDILKLKILEFVQNGDEGFLSKKTLYSIPEDITEFIEEIKEHSNSDNPYQTKILGHHFEC